MKFLKWFFATTWFHLLAILVAFILLATWEPGSDKTLGFISVGMVLIVLTIGKLHYYNKNKKYFDERYK